MLTRIVNVALLAIAIGSAATGSERTIPAEAKVFITPMNGFETYVKAAISKKKVPLVIVEQRDAADFELSGSAESEKASTAKKVIMLDWHSKEQAQHQNDQYQVQ